MEQLLQIIRNIGVVRVAAMSVVAVILLGFFAYISFNASGPTLAPLYNTLSTDDASAIARELGAMGETYDISSDGAQILVKHTDILRLRMMLAQKNLPNQGALVGYEIFDKDSALGTSNFVHNINFFRALEGELSRTISSLSTVRTARVHLVMPKRELFARTSVEPSASVMLKLNGEMGKEEALAIRHLVSSAVPGLKAARVTIVDGKGKTLLRGVDDGEEASGSLMELSDAEEYRQHYEKKLQRTIIELLEQIVGGGRVRAEISADISFDRVTTNEELYDPDSQVARSVQTSEERSESGRADSNEVSVANNLPQNQAGQGSAGDRDIMQKTDEITNYEISRTVTNRVSEVGVVERISVAVLVDGRYTQEEDGGEIVYTPRTDDELDRIKTLVQSAIGYDEARGDVVEVINMRFSYEVPVEEERGPFDDIDFDSIIRTVVIGTVAIMFILLVIRPLVVRAFDINPMDMEEEEMLAQAAASQRTRVETVVSDDGQVRTVIVGGDGDEDDDIDLDAIQHKVDATPARKVNDLVENNPEETLSVLRTWMNQK